MAEQNWIEEQKKMRLFAGASSSSDALRMLEKSETNRYISSRQAQKLITARYLGKIYGVTCYDELCDMVESAELCVDGRSRDNYMKVAIEQWQGKLAALKSKISLEHLA